jgi:hypothetical protein
MSVPATEMGSVGNIAPTSTVQPTMAQTAAAAASVVPGPIGALASLFSGATSSTSSSFLGNAALVAVGAILTIGALLISSKGTVVQVAAHAGVA